MAFCKKCGEQLEEDANFCPKCGTAVDKPVDKSAKEEPKAEKNSFDKLMDAKDLTDKFDAKDIDDNIAMGILAYLSILVLIPIFAAKESKFARFHSNQGLILFIVEIICGVAFGILSWIPFIGIVFGIIGWLAGLACLAFTIIGIVNVATKKAKELPLIGGFELLK